jgi:glycosyltransferase involved in cell wall biosynthesis
MKILWLCSWYPNRYIFYNGFFVRRQAEAVARFADIATLHAVEKSAEILLPDGSKQKIRGGSTFDIEINKKTHFEVIVYFPKSSNSIFKLINQFRAYHKGFNLIKREWGTPDLIHLHVIISAGIYALFLHFFHKIPFLITEHSSMYRLETGVFERSNWLFKTIVRQCVKRAKAIIALSPFYASTMLQHGLINRFFYVPNVVDTDLFQLKNKLKNRLKTIENTSLINSEFNPQLIKNKELKTFNLIHVSGLHDSIKNITGILNSIKKLSEIRQDFILDIIGDPFEQPPYKALVQTLGIEKFIRFHQHLPIKEVAEQMQKANIFVLFSRFEGLPCVILEAMAAGLPVVATETGGISDWVTEGSGRLVNSEDEVALVEILDFMMTHLHAFNPELIRKKIVETCSYEAVGQAIVNVYKQSSVQNVGEV